jgi:hypothetical protein
MFYISVTVAVIFECLPRAKAWDPTIPGHCVNQNVLLTSTGPANLISDFLIFFLPVWAIWHLQMPFNRKISASAAFAIGLFGCTCSAIRLTYNAELSRSGDATYIIMQNQLWAYVRSYFLLLYMLLSITTETPRSQSPSSSQTSSSCLVSSEQSWPTRARPAPPLAINAQGPRRSLKSPISPSP